MCVCEREKDRDIKRWRERVKEIGCSVCEIEKENERGRGSVRE